MTFNGGDFGSLDARRACNVIYQWMIKENERIQQFSGYIENKGKPQKEVSTPVDTPRNKVAQMALISGYQTLPQEV